MTLLQAIVYGVIQGATEFLPISSTAHIRIVPSLLGWEDPGASFTAVIQIGTLAAVLIYFRKELAAALVAWAKSIRGGPAAQTNEARLGWAIFFGTFPIVIAGVLLQKHIKGDWRSLYVIGAALILMGLLMGVADRLGRGKKRIESISIKDGVIVGLWQAMSLIPGASRSGSTITGALFAGYERSAAARLSFLLSVPSIAAAGLKELWDERKAILGAQLIPVIVATVVSFIVGYWAIGFLIRFLQTRSTLVFVVYRVVLGVALLTMLWQGVLQPLQKDTTPPAIPVGDEISHQ